MAGMGGRGGKEQMTTLDEIGQEKQRISERLARLDGERTKLGNQLNELEIAERILTLPHLPLRHIKPLWSIFRPACRAAGSHPHAHFKSGRVNVHMRENSNVKPSVCPIWHTDLDRRRVRFQSPGVSEFGLARVSPE
jgi:hypothetical protein